MQTQGKRSILAVDKTTTGETYLVCPNCRQNKRLLHIDPDTEAKNLPLYCRKCKHQVKIDIVHGQCFKS